MPSLSPMVANALILLTGVVLYAFAWVSVGGLPRAIRGIARLVLAMVLVAPLAFGLWGGQFGGAPDQTGGGTPPREIVRVPQAPEAGTAPRSASAPPMRPAAPITMPPAASPPPPPVIAAPAPAMPPPAAPAPPPAASAPAPGGSAADPATTPRSAPRTVGGAPPRVADAESPDWSVVPVFFGTDRKRANETKRVTYSAERGGRLDLGRVLVTVPKAHQVPNVERPWAIRIPFFQVTIYEQPEDPKKHFTVKEITALSRAEFIAAVRERLGTSRRFKNQALVFVHGYNNDFDFAAFRTAQIAYDLDYDGVPFLYSWPSSSGVTSFHADLASSEQAEPYLREFLELVVRESGAESISVIAHSMGNLPLLRVLRDLGPSLPQGVKLDQLILAAPAVDRDVFRRLAQDLRRVGRGVTLYASASDRAMSVSRGIGNVTFAGDIPADGPVVVEGVDTIDISALSTDTLALNHSLYAERTALLKDIGALLATGAAPSERNPKMERLQVPAGVYWKYPGAP